MIKNLVVVGSGVMGRGIAYVSAVGGFNVKLVDIKEEQLENAEKELEKIFQKGVERGKLDEAGKDAARKRLRYSTGLSGAVRDADLVI
ncbi:MAG TPA: 3-hydroxyacyl-CoA dehydrogenase NAD-binding domain-containing protein, partial [Bacillales bacterium]|nr:3-hydroxyacyl-CoA dehydrogenase NAD-binding domain-containing protein [Bacillales bacterium]